MKFPHRRQFLRLAAGVAVLPAVSRVARAQAYPTRPVRMIVPLTAGSAADILARRLATKMAENWGQPVVVENRPGAGTTMGTDAVAKAAPDGHTLLINSAAFAASAAIYSKLPYDPIKDLIPISQVATAPVIVVAAPSLGARSIKDLVELGKRKPGELSFGSAGVGSSRDRPISVSCIVTRTIVRIGNSEGHVSVIVLLAALSPTRAAKRIPNNEAKHIGRQHQPHCVVNEPVDQGAPP